MPTKENSTKPSFIKMSGVGLSAGLLGSLAGMGGGFVAVPMMTSVGVSQHVAIGTSLAGVVATGCSGAAAYFLAGQVDILAALTVACTGALTASLGARAAAALNAQTLKRLLGMFMMAVAPIVPLKAQILDAIGQRRSFMQQNEDESKQEDSWIRRSVSLLAIGSASGFLAGLFGVGGGAIVVPALALATEMDHKTMLGTSLLAMVPTAIAGLATHAKLGHLHTNVAFPLVIGTCLGAFLGGKLASDFIPEQPMKFGFGLLMIVLGGRTFLNSFR
eukprot:CAMPEP_0197315340 /NCGR_PEP_ID=MMETSP0891-20130614/37827_1 /TAXON_ID=44058 ORGANISM="Aureoumbra lagunensis, Strain CCMP1510" /NCGR_SAMPLE_ID=MMETSP0891 /ASSEMBLY_ACC=CAM_ASM_000534 /LENGTH=274 /DNA_ID=CAMNT_0042804241 /DNA_START=90 /DNA_END=914 /DNA_ORIENTATION=+